MTNLQHPGLETISRSIHPACEMYKYIRTVEPQEQRATELYFQTTEFTVGNLLRFFAEEQVDPAEKTILDFASGYGRFTRYFVKLFREVTVSDVEQGMLGFCRNEFDVQSFRSLAKDPSVIERRSEKYDVVFCFSLFTHLNDRVWQAGSRSSSRWSRIEDTSSYQLMVTSYLRSSILFLPAAKAGNRNFFF